MKYYIASKLENVAQVRELKSILDAAGWEHTYDWTVHGSVQKESYARMAEVALSEFNGVEDADVVIVLLPGGRGTHVEFGVALATGANVFLYSPNPDEFEPTGKICVFYRDPYIKRFTSWPEMVAALLEAE